MKECTVSGLTIYPVKGCQGVSVDEIHARKSGIVGDRELMPVRNGAAYAQRDHPRLARVRVQVLEDGRVRLFNPDAGEFIHTRRETGDALPTMLIYNEYATVDQGDEIAAWFSEAMGEDGIRVVSLPKPHTRLFPLPRFLAIHEKPQSQLYDVAPILLENQASLDDLNSRTEHPVPMDRFRANIIVEGLAAFEEDNLQTLATDAVELAYLDACERCIMTTTDQATGERPHKDPLRTLNAYRKREEHRYASGLVFGAYLAVTREGMLRVGDCLAVSLQHAAASTP